MNVMKVCFKIIPPRPDLGFQSALAVTTDKDPAKVFGICVGSLMSLSIVLCGEALGARSVRALVGLGMGVDMFEHITLGLFLRLASIALEVAIFDFGRVFCE